MNVNCENLKIRYPMKITIHDNITQRELIFAIIISFYFLNMQLNRKKENDEILIPHADVQTWNSSIFQ